MKLVFLSIALGVGAIVFLLIRGRAMKASIAHYLGLSLWHVFAIGLGVGAIAFLLMYFNEARIKGWLARRKNDGDWPVARIENET